MSQQYSGSFDTDTCTSAACASALSAPNSTNQGQMFDRMTAAFHGGKRHHNNRKSKKASRKSKKASRKHRRAVQRGGAAPYPGEFSQMLPADMHAAADVNKLDTAFAQLPAFVGKYGLAQAGGSRRHRKGSRKTTRRVHRKQQAGGFGYTPGSPTAPNYMILSPAEEPKAFLNPQWYTENQVVPTFQGPVNAFAQQSYNNQFNYAQRAGGSRKNRKDRKAKDRKAKASRKNRKVTHRRK